MKPFSSPERDAALTALLEAGFGPDTWRVSSLREAAGPDADLLFPDGAVEMVEAWFDLGDRRLHEEAAVLGIGELPRLSERVRALVLLRLALDEPHHAAKRQALAILALPGNAATGSRALARSVDTIWREAGDRAADFSWYTKRATLAAILAATSLYALDATRAPEDVAAFLDRRLADTARFGRWRRRLTPGRSAA